MTRKNWIQVAIVLLLAGAYVYRFTDWIRVPGIQVEVSTRPTGRVPDGAAVLPTLMLLDREYRLDSIRVVAISNVPAAILNQPVWHLVASGKAEPQRGFEYGESLKGYRISRQPDPLIPDGRYRIEVSAGRASGSREFTARGPAPSLP